MYTPTSRQLKEEKEDIINILGLKNVQLLIIISFIL